MSETIATAASTIHHFTGNNIGPKGDLASRALTVRLEVDRADPENRSFKHNDPVEWTEAHRGQIMGALYTLLLGNPFLLAPMGTTAKTRFKVWWRLIGSAVEHAAKQHNVTAFSGDANWNKDCPPKEIDFKELFLEQEEEDEESASLADVLAGMAVKWPDDARPQPNHIAQLINSQSDYITEADQQLGVTLREFLFPEATTGQIVSAKAVGRRLSRHIGEPVRKGDQTLILRKTSDTHTKVISYYVESR